MQEGAFLRWLWERCMTWEREGDGDGESILSISHSSAPEHLACLLSLNKISDKICFKRAKYWYACNELKADMAPLWVRMEELIRCLCVGPWGRLCCLCWTTGCKCTPLPLLLQTSFCDGAPSWSRHHSWNLQCSSEHLVFQGIPSPCYCSWMGKGPRYFYFILV